MEKNGTSASPATARASSVLPVPGGPKSSTPLGIRAPMASKRLGDRRNVVISRSSWTASSAPATSANVVFGASAGASRAGARRNALERTRATASRPAPEQEPGAADDDDEDQER